jgi:hypothetical protein
MASTADEPDTNQVLLDLLKRTAQAHGVYEMETGKPDADWPTWYAAYMTQTLREAGYRLTREARDP